MVRPTKELLRDKRDGKALTPDELRAIAAGIGDGGLSDAQVAAFAMAVFFRGLDTTELPAFTLGMRDSGTVLDWSDIDKPVLDKHSTGGVGDKVSLILAPLVAACGGAVPMISGRGLGHTGGTLDKLETIPGYNATPDAALMGKVVREVGCVIGGQTDDLAPADRKLYAIRDATGSVEAIPLIVSSILSKKLAAGLGGLVMDVKHGNGAFMSELDDARALARALVDVAVAAGLPTVALLTDMDRVLGATAGNALEVRESIELLRDPSSADPRLLAVTLELTRALLDLGGLGDADPEAALASGAAAERFGAMVARPRRPERHDGQLRAAPRSRAGDPRGLPGDRRRGDRARHARAGHRGDEPRRRPRGRERRDRPGRRAGRGRRAGHGGGARRPAAGDRPRARRGGRRRGRGRGARGDHGGGDGTA